MTHLGALPDYAGLRSYTKAWSTGTYVGVYDGEEAGMDTDGGRWQTVCEEHGRIISHGSLALPMSFRSCPQEWCEQCSGIAERAVPTRPKPGDRFISRHALTDDARPPYTEDSYAEQVVTATRRWGPGETDIAVFYTSANLWDSGSHKGRWHFDFNRADNSVRSWL